MIYASNAPCCELLSNEYLCKIENNKHCQEIRTEML